MEPMALKGEQADWAQAAVYATPLLIRYQEPSGLHGDVVIHPRSIVGRKVRTRGVRPDMINAYCPAECGMRAFHTANIVWAADAHSGEFIDDLYGYLGGAQPGGAPNPSYGAAGTPLPPKALHRHI